MTSADPVRPPTGYPFAFRNASHRPRHALAARSQFWSQSSPFAGVRQHPTGPFASVNGDVGISPYLGLRIWKAVGLHRPSSQNVVSSAAGTGIILSTTPKPQDPRVSDGRPGSRRPRSPLAKSLRQSDRQGPCDYLGMVPIDSSLSGEFSTGSVEETENAQRMTE